MCSNNASSEIKGFEHEEFGIQVYSDIKNLKIVYSDNKGSEIRCIRRRVWKSGVFGHREYPDIKQIQT